MLVKARNTIAQVDGATAYNEYCGRFVFLLKVILDEITVEDFYARRGLKIGLGQRFPASLYQKLS